MNATRLWLIMAGIILLTGAGYAQSAMDGDAFLSEVNQNNDKTLSIRELDAYASKKFKELNTTGHKSLSRTELGDRISDTDFDAANTNHRKDQTLTQGEFVAYVDRLFKKANTKGQKSLSLSELESPAGEKLIALLH
jgi:hypothetical protein